MSWDLWTRAQTSFVHVHAQAAEFILDISRVYHLDTVEDTCGNTIRSGLFGFHQLLFTSKVDQYHEYVTRYHLDSTNTFIFTTVDNDTECFKSLPNICVDRYSKNNCRDKELERVCEFITSISNKPNVGILINEFNTN